MGVVLRLLSLDRLDLGWHLGTWDFGGVSAISRSERLTVPKLCTDSVVCAEHLLSGGLEMFTCQAGGTYVTSPQYNPWALSLS